MPDKAIICGDPATESLMFSDALSAPVAIGENISPRLHPAPTGNVCGQLLLMIAKSAVFWPDKAMEVREIVWVPEF